MGAPHLSLILMFTSESDTLDLKMTGLWPKGTIIEKCIPLNQRKKMVEGLILELCLVNTTIKDLQINKCLILEVKRMLQGIGKSVIASFKQLQIKIVCVDNGIIGESCEL